MIWLNCNTPGAFTGINTVMYLFSNKAVSKRKDKTDKQSSVARVTEWLHNIQ